MGLIPWRSKQSVPVRRENAAEPWPQLAQFRTEVDRVFDRFMRDPWAVLETAGNLGSWRGGAPVPALDVKEDEKQVRVAVELPGVDPKDIDISLSGNQLAISGEKREQQESKGEGYYRSERSFGSFQRVVELPQGVDPDSISADYKNGVLIVTANKTGAAERKKIPISNV